MSKPFNLYGRQATLTASHFLSQGYCRKAAEYCLNEINAGTYTVERATEQARKHILEEGCEQCLWANRVKINLSDFLQAKFPERFVEWQQGLLKDSTIQKAWLDHLVSDDPVLFRWFATHRENFVAYEPVHEGFGVGKTHLKT